MELLRWFEGIRTGFLDTFFETVTEAGGGILAVAIICVIYWCLDKRFAYKLGLGYFVSGMAVQGLKITCRISRPWVLDPTLNPVQHKIATATGYSFPSGHSQNAVNLYGMLALRLKKWYLKVLMAVVAILVMVSRMYLGYHTPKDVFTAAAIAVVIGLIIYLVGDRVTLTEKSRLVLALCVGVLSVAVLVYDGILYSNGTIDYSNAADCFKLGGSGLAFAVCWYVEATYIRFKEGGISFMRQILKVVLGVAGVLVFQTVPKLFADPSPVFDSVRYFLTISWAMGVYPLIIKRFFQN